jgi:long-chain fatty acid transport protein
MLIAGICLLAIAAAPAMASGFSIYEQSAKASGQAGAWVARADDAAAVWYNPAAMTRLDGMNVQFGMNLITVGSDTELISSDPEWGLTEPTEFETDQDNATPIHLYFTQKINDRVAWGLGITTPFGLVSAWEDLPVTLSHRRAELHTFLVNPNVAFALSDSWSLAVGVAYLFADVTEFSRDIDQSALLPPAEEPVIGGSDLTGDGDDWGWDVAAHYVTDRWSFGFTYRSELSPNIEGDVVFSDIHPALGPAGADLFPNGPGSAMLNLPAQAAIGVAWDIGPDWTMEFDITWAEWGVFEELAIDFENETSVLVEVAPDVFVEVPVVEDIVLREDWSNTMAVRLGAAWRVAEGHELRFGALTDEGPTTGETLRPSIPDADRRSVTFGYGLTAGNWNIDFYYMPLWFDTIVANGDAEEGVIDGTYSSFTHLAGVTANFKF